MSDSESNTQTGFVCRSAAKTARADPAIENFEPFFRGTVMLGKEYAHYSKTKFYTAVRHTCFAFIFHVFFFHFA